MTVRFELVAGLGTFALVFGALVTLATLTGSTALRTYSILAGAWGGSAMGIFAGLAAHLARGPAKYEPLEGDASAWGLMEFDEDAGRRGEHK